MCQERFRFPRVTHGVLPIQGSAQTGHSARTAWARHCGSVVRVDARCVSSSVHLDEPAVAYDEKSDGMYPLLTNDRKLSPAQVLEAHKGQPKIEKRFEQIKTVHEIAPVCLKSEARIEALFTLYFLALLVQALIERELRRAMKRENIDELPLYPEQRQCKHPTTEQILRLFSLAERHTLLSKGHTVQVFYPDITELQRQVLTLLGMPSDAFRISA